MPECAVGAYSGLTAELDLLFSCHICANKDMIPFVKVQSDNDYKGIYGLSKSEKGVECLLPSLESFGISYQNSNDFKFPSNCAFGVMSPHSELNSSSSSIEALPINGEKLKAFCVACKPGFTPFYSSIQANV